MASKRLIDLRADELDSLSSLLVPLLPVLLILLAKERREAEDDLEVVDSAAVSVSLEREERTLRLVEADLSPLKDSTIRVMRVWRGRRFEIAWAILIVAGCGAVFAYLLRVAGCGDILFAGCSLQSCDCCLLETWKCVYSAACNSAKQRHLDI